MSVVTCFFLYLWHHLIPTFFSFRTSPPDLLPAPHLRLDVLGAEQPAAEIFPEPTRWKRDEHVHHSHLHQVWHSEDQTLCRCRNSFQDAVLRKFQAHISTWGCWLRLNPSLSSLFSEDDIPDILEPTSTDLHDEILNPEFSGCFCDSYKCPVSRKIRHWNKFFQSRD